MLRYDRQTKPGLVALYDIRPGNGAGPFLQPQSPHGAWELKGSVKWRNWEITRKAKWRGSIYRVVRFFHLRSSCTTHLMLFSECPPITMALRRCRAWRSRVKEPNNFIYAAASLALRVIFVRHKRPHIYASGMTISGERTEQHVIGFGELAAVD